MRDAIRHALSAVMLAVIWVYRTCLSPFKPPCCRFSPTCSAYATTAIRRFGPLKGSWLVVWRLARCQPFYHGPWCDPVPETALKAERINHTDSDCCRGKSP